MNDAINDRTYPFLINGRTVDYRIRNIVLFTENEGDQPTCWYFYTTTEERIPLSIPDGNNLVGDIIDNKSDGWYDRNKNKNYIFEIVGEDELNRLDDNFRTMDTNPLQLSDEDEDEDENNNQRHHGLHVNTGVLKKIVAVGVGVVLVVVGGSHIKKAIERKKSNGSNIPTTSNNDNSRSDFSFEGLLNDTTNTTQKAYINNLNNCVNLFNSNSKSKLDLSEASAIKIVSDGKYWSNTDISDVFNGASLNVDNIMGDYRSAFLKVVYALSTTDNNYDQLGIIDLNSTSLTRAYKYILDNSKDANNLIPAFYEKAVDAINNGKATWEDYACVYATYIRYGGLSNDTLVQIGSKWDEDASTAVERVAFISSRCFSSSTAYTVNDFTAAWADEYSEYADFSTKGINESRFRAVRLILAKDSFPKVDKVSLEVADELSAEEVTEVTTEVEVTTTVPVTEDDYVATTNGNGGNNNTTTTRQFDYDSDYSTTHESVYSTTSENNTTTTENTTDYFVQDYTTTKPAPSTTVTTTEYTTEYFASSEIVDGDNWWETAAEAEGMSYNTEEQPIVYVKK